MVHGWEGVDQKKGRETVPAHEGMTKETATWDCAARLYTSSGFWGRKRGGEGGEKKEA